MVKKSTATRFLRRNFDALRYVSLQEMHQIELYSGQVEKIHQLGNNEGLFAGFVTFRHGQEVKN
jgi:hypothetical protein